MSIDPFDSAFTAIQELIAECAGDSDRFAERLRAERIPHLSYSQVTTVEACPYRYYLQYVRGIEPEPVPEYFTKGKLLHQLIARDYSNGHRFDAPTEPGQELSTSRFDAPTEPGQELSTSHFDGRHFDAPTELGQELSVRPEYEVEVALQFSGENLAQLLNALELHRRHAWRGAQVLGVEHPFVMRVDPALPPLVGVIDLVLVTDHKSDLWISLERSDLQSLSLQGQRERSFILVDHKTGRNFYPDDELQVAIYARYIQQAYGGESVRLFYDHYRWVNHLERIRKPAFQRVEVRADPAHWPQDLARIRAAYEIICKIREIYEEWNTLHDFGSPLHDSDMTSLHCGGLRSSPWKSSEDPFLSRELRNSLLRITSASGECFRCPYRGMCHDSVG